MLFNPITKDKFSSYILNLENILIIAVETEMLILFQPIIGYLN